MTWVLFVLVITAGGPTSSVVYFPDEEACKVGQASILAGLKNLPVADVRFQVTCMPTGKPQ